MKAQELPGLFLINVKQRLYCNQLYIDESLPTLLEQEI